MVEEVQKAAPEVASKTPKKRDYLALFLAGIAIVVVIGGAFFMLTHKNNTNQEQLTGLAIYTPEKFLDKSWTLDVKRTNLAEMPSSFKAEMLTQNITDVATWEFSKDDDKLYFWTRIYQDNDSRTNSSYQFNGPLVWRDGLRANVAMGEEGIIGVYRTTGNDPLMVYVADGNQIWYISYYNYINNDGNAYNATNMNEDKQFLLDLMREFYGSFKTA